LDIAGYIQDLLWEYECVIIPGFGGILATYRPAEMVLAEHIIYPPTKSLAFNEYLINNDGLLVNHICRTAQISFSEASEQVEAWVQVTKSLLANNEEIYLPRIGRFHRDIERNLRFDPDTTVNYLPSAYGLRKVVAEPILRSKSADTIEIIAHHRASYTLPRANKTWAMAAVVLLFLTLGTVINLIYQGVDVKPLDLNAASVLGFLEHFDRPDETGPGPKATINKDMPPLSTAMRQPSAVHIATATGGQSDTAMESVTHDPAGIVAPAGEEPAPAVRSTTGRKYYIIIGAFRKHANLQNALAYLKEKHPGEAIYEDTSIENKRIGFYAGDSYQEASVKLKEARKDQQDSWLLVKK
jgi:hypothetical protein